MDRQEIDTRTSRRQSRGLGGGSKAGETAQTSQKRASVAQAQKTGQVFSSGNVISREGVPIDPKSQEGKVIEEILETQRKTRIINAEQKKLFQQITGARSAKEATKILEAQTRFNPNIGTFQQVIDTETGKVKETRGRLGIGTGVVRPVQDLPRKDDGTLDRTKLATRSPLPPIADLIDKKGEVVARGIRQGGDIGKDFTGEFEFFETIKPTREKQGPIKPAELIGPPRPTEPIKGAISPTGGAATAGIGTLAGVFDKTKGDPIRDVIEGFSAPFINLGKVIAKSPEAIAKDIERFKETGEFPQPGLPEFLGGPGPTGAGQEFFEQEVSPDLDRTLVDSFLSGKPTNRSQIFDIASGIGEAALFASPLALTKVGKVGKAAPKPLNLQLIGTKTAKAGGPSKARARQEEIPGIDSLFPLTKSPKGQITFPANRKLRQVPADVFFDDLARPKVTSFDSIFFPLGRGAGLIVPRGGPKPITTGLFPKTKGGGTFSKPIFKEPTVPKGGRLVINKSGQIQVQRTKLKQKTGVIKSQRQSTALDILFSKPRFKKKQVSTDALLQEFLLKPIQKTKTKQALVTKVKQKTKQSPLVALLPKLTPVQKQKQRLKQPFPLALRAAQRQRPRQRLTPILIPKTTPLLTTIPKVPPRPPRAPLIGPPFFPFFPGGRRDPDRPRKGRQSRLFLTDPVDPLRPGVIAAEGVSSRVSRSSSIFGKSDRDIARARKKAFRGKKRDPLGPPIKF